MGNNYHLLVYPTKDLKLLIPYDGQTINNLEIPQFLDNKLKVNYKEKYKLEIDELFNIISIIKVYDKKEWIYKEINLINLYNKNINNIDNIRKFNYEIPEDIIINNLLWEFIIGTIKLGKFPLFTGGTGTGKTVLAKAIAKVLKYDFYYLNCGNLLKPKQTLVGTIQAREGSTFLVDSEFLTYFKSDKPTIILLDELSRVSSQGGNSLMTITDREQAYIYVEELGERIYKGKDVIFIATANFGIQYVDTRRLDDALMNRFIPFHLNYLSEEDEIKLIKMKVPNIKHNDIINLVKTCNLLRENYDSLGKEISHRHTIDMAGYFSIGFSYSEVINMILINLFVNGSDDRREQVEQILDSKK